jgi:hypothetical protein
MRKGSLINEEMSKYLVIYDEAVSQIWLCNRSLLNFLSMRNFLSFLSVKAFFKNTVEKAIHRNSEKSKIEPVTVYRATYCAIYSGLSIPRYALVPDAADAANHSPPPPHRRHHLSSSYRQQRNRGRQERITPETSCGALLNLSRGGCNFAYNS